MIAARHQRRRSALAAAAFMLTLASAQPSVAQQVRAGLLTCDVSAGIGLIITSQKQLSCSFVPDNPAIATDLANLGNVVAEQRDLMAARLLLERSIELRERQCGLDHPDVAIDLGNAPNRTIGARSNICFYTDVRCPSSRSTERPRRGVY